MKKILLSLGLLASFMVFAQEDCTEPFISEYVEGWGTNKALEFYNPTNEPIDLSEYIVIRYSNGSNFAGSKNVTQLEGIIAPYSVYVGVIDKRDPNGTGQEAPVWEELQDKADGFYDNDYDISNVFYFNGNDAIAFAKGSKNDHENAQLIDLFGRIGEDPDTDDDHFGWTTEYPHVGVGVDVTKDHSLIRKPNVKHGVTANPTVFDPLAEWDSLPPVVPVLDEDGNEQFNNNGNLIVEGNWFSLGEHECDCAEGVGVNKESYAVFSVYPNPTTTGEVQLKSDKEIVQVDVYSAVGQHVLSLENTQGIQSIQIGEKAGVYIVNIKTADNHVATQRVIVK